MLASIGVLFRVTSKLATIFTIFYLGYNYNFGHVYHGYHLYLGTLIILSFAPKSADNKNSWHLSLVKSWIVYVMFITGVQKLYYGEGIYWAFSDNLYIKVLTLFNHTSFAKWILNSNLIVSQIFAFFSLFIVELFSPLSIINKKLGILYFFIWCSFHVFVTLTFGGHLSFYSQIFIYTAFLPLTEIRDKLKCILRISD
jgi:hypothetical protein